MKLVKCDYSIKCDVAGCTKLADYSIRSNGGDISGQINICKDCLQEIKNAVEPNEQTKE